MRTAFFLPLLFVCGNLLGADSIEPSSLPSSLQKKLDRATSNDVEKVVVFCVPEDLLLEFGMTPQRLEENYWSMVVLKNFQLSGLKTGFLSSLKGSGFRTRSGAVGDTRLGCVFYNKAGERLVSITFDVSGNGAIDKTPVASNLKFLEFLREKFAFR